MISQGLINFIIGYLIFINMIGFGFIVLVSRQSDIQKLNVKKVNTFMIILTVLGGFIGLMVAGEMTQFRDENVVLKRMVPLIVIGELMIVFGIYFIKAGGFNSLNLK